MGHGGMLAGYRKSDLRGLERGSDRYKIIYMHGIIFIACFKCFNFFGGFENEK